MKNNVTGRMDLISSINLSDVPRSDRHSALLSGNPQRPRWQAARLDRIAPCPTLPHLSSALHTSIDGIPRDPSHALSGRDSEVDSVFALVGETEARLGRLDEALDRARQF
jgi:hypothetical protein